MWNKNTPGVWSSEAEGSVEAKLEWPLQVQLRVGLGISPHRYDHDIRMKMVPSNDSKCRVPRDHTCFHLGITFWEEIMRGFAEHKGMSLIINKIYCFELVFQGASQFLRLALTSVDALIISIRKWQYFTSSWFQHFLLSWKKTPWLKDITTHLTHSSDGFVKYLGVKAVVAACCFCSSLLPPWVIYPV